MLTIRPMTEVDIPKVVGIERSIFSIPWSEKSFEDSIRLEHTIYLVAVEPNQGIVGYCGMYRVFNEGEITNVAVDEPYRRLGVATALLNELMAEGKNLGIDTFFLEVRESNLRARQLYRKLGFENVGVRKNFYEKPLENAVIMWKR